MNTYYVNGKFVPKNEAFISVADLSVIRGYGIFDFFRTYNKKPFYMKEHLKRFLLSAEEIGMDLPWTMQELENLVYETLKRNDCKEYNIRIIATGGETEDNILPSGKPGIIIIVSEYKNPPEHFYTKGIKLALARQGRFYTSAKTLDYMSAVIAIRKAREIGAAEAIYIDDNDNVLEGTTSNIFAFIDKNRLVTPKNGILYGITREVTIKLAKQHFNVLLQDIKLKELLKADEVFITSSTKEIAPVTNINGNIIGAGKPGENTKKLMRIFSEHTKEVS